MKGKWTSRLTALCLTGVLLTVSCLPAAGEGESPPAGANQPVTEFIFDDKDAQYTGNWTLNEGELAEQRYGTGFRYVYYGELSTATYTAVIEQEGWYEISAWWTTHPNRATNAPFTITCGQDEPVTVRVNQEEKGGVWNRLQSVYAKAGDTVTVVLSNDGADEYVIADGLKIALEDGAGAVVLEETDADYTGGGWVVETASSQTDRHGPAFRYVDGSVAQEDAPTHTATYRYTPQAAGYYEVYAWWPALSNRPTAAPYTVSCGEQTQTVRVNQQEKGSQWNLLGYVEAQAGQEISVVVSNNAGGGWMVVDAVKFQPAAAPQTFSVTLDYDQAAGSVAGKTAGILAGEQVTLTARPGEGYEFKGWYSQDRLVCHTPDYTLTVLEDVTLSPRFVKRVMEKGIVLDNTDAVLAPAAPEGQWVTQDSAGEPQCYGDSFSYVGGWIHAGDEPSHTAAYTFTAPEDGLYKVYGWWIEHTNRTAAAPYTITCGQKKETVRVNQQRDGGMWNLLGQVNVKAGQEIQVVIANDANEGYVIADAVGIERAGDLLPEETTYQITLTYDQAAGRVTGKTTGIAKDEEVTLTAEPRPGWELDGWYLNGQKVGGEEKYTLTVERDLTLEVRFQETAPLGGVIVDDKDAAYTGSWTEETADCIDQRYGDGFRYKVWNGAASQPDSTATFTMEAQADGYYEIYAWWTTNPNRADDAPYTLSAGGGQRTVRVNQREKGGMWNLLGGVVAKAGQEIRVMLGNNADNGYVIADAVQFVKSDLDPNAYTVTLNYNKDGGSVEGKTAGILAGEQITLTASPKTGWQFDGWYRDNAQVSADREYPLFVEGDVTLEARFSQITQPAGPDKTALQTNIADAKRAKTDGRYAGTLPSIQKELDAALQAAQTVEQNPNADEKAVTAALERLAAALEGLSVRAGDKAELSAMMAYAQGLDMAKFQKNGQAGLQSALEGARAVIADQEARQPAVDEALYALVHALAALRYAPVQ